MRFLSQLWTGLDSEESPLSEHLMLCTCKCLYLRHCDTYSVIDSCLAPSRNSTSRTSKSTFDDKNSTFNSINLLSLNKNDSGQQYTTSNTKILQSLQHCRRMKGWNVFFIMVFAKHFGHWKVYLLSWLCTHCYTNEGIRTIRSPPYLLPRGFEPP